VNKIRYKDPRLLRHSHVIFTTSVLQALKADKLKLFFVYKRRIKN